MMIIARLNAIDRVQQKLRPNVGLAKNIDFDAFTGKPHKEK